MKNSRKVFTYAVSMIAALFVYMTCSATDVYAAGNVYTCTVNPCYAHPVTGEIEDSGGEASYETGQGMVEGALHSTGIMEVTDSGEYYLTIRMSLMDFSSNHSFYVQSNGESGWTSPVVYSTGSTTDSNGTAMDFCIQVPNESCIVRGSMYVEPMGRDVIFYCYPSDYVEGNSTDMNATMITETPAEAPAVEEPAEAPAETPAEAPAEKKPVEKKELEKAPELKSDITEAATPEEGNATPDISVLNKAQGLSLSVKGETEEAAAPSSTGTITTIVVTVIVTILVLAVIGGIVFAVMKKKKGGKGQDE